MYLLRYHHIDPLHELFHLLLLEQEPLLLLLSEHLGLVFSLVDGHPLLKLRDHLDLQLRQVQRPLTNEVLAGDRLVQFLLIYMGEEAGCGFPVARDCGSFRHSASPMRGAIACMASWGQAELVVIGFRVDAGLG